MERALAALPERPSERLYVTPILERAPIVDFRNPPQVAGLLHNLTWEFDGISWSTQDLFASSPHQSPTDDEVERVARTERVADDLDRASTEMPSNFAGLIAEASNTIRAIATMTASPQIDALIKAAQWQPIETAPKDGTWFMICNAAEGFDSYEVGRYEPLMSPRFVEVEGGLYRKEEAKLYDWRGFNNFHRATHWMPLAAAPFTRQPEEGSK